MRINDINYGLYSYRSQINRPNIKDNKKQVNSDDLAISTVGKEISQGIQSDQLVRQQHIEKLKQQVTEGTYKVDANKVAKSLVDFWGK